MIAIRILSIAIFFSLYLLPITNAKYILKAKEKEIIHKIENYLNSIKTYKSKFIQYTKQNKVPIYGEFIIEKEGKAYIKYGPPMNLEITINNDLMLYTNTDLKQSKYINIKEKISINKLLSKSNIHLLNLIDLKLLRYSKNYIRIEFSINGDNNYKKFALVFQKINDAKNKRKLKLRKIIIFETKYENILEFYKMQENAKIDSSIFTIIDKAKKLLLKKN